ncbi:DUF3800 domain-containing protein [Erythrobacter sp.]|uniref:DUF3800 domain-containing protein n=1 Tax=Erythrobacter sp. TaxID=1042 RepID=UPI0025CD4012|nr:DUF3800 domain-containing protein [Erythrobacter sp.]
MDRFLFSDEAGDFTFNRNNNVSRYFIICTVTTDTLDLAEALTRLRHDLLRERAPLGDCFHATTDAQNVRDRVFATMMQHDFRFQFTACEKSKAEPQVTASKERFYKIPWFYHFRHGIAPHLQPGDRLIVTAASIGSKKERASYTSALRDVVNQSAPTVDWAIDFRPALADPILQAADYCAWAVQRAWERRDTRSIDLIHSRLTYSYDLWQRGKKHYY